MPGRPSARVTRRVSVTGRTNVDDEDDDRRRPSDLTSVTRGDIRSKLVKRRFV